MTAALAAALAVFSVATTPPPPAPPGFASLLVGGPGDTSRGTVLRPAGCGIGNLTRPGADWEHDHGNLSFVFDQTYSDFGSYRLDNTTATCVNAKGGMCFARQFLAGSTLPMLPNRRYIVAAVVRTSFPPNTAEVDPQIRVYATAPTGKPGDQPADYIFQRMAGIPSSTSAGLDGWQRWEWSFVTPPVVVSAWLSVNEFIVAGTPMPSFEMADLAIIETPPMALMPLPGVSGAVFRGSVGSLPMVISECSIARVTTTAAQYDFSPSNNTIAARQRIDAPRQVASWSLSASFAGLTVLSFQPGAAGHCVLGNAALSIGVQPDGVMVFVPQHDDLTITLTNMIGGTFNRLTSGDLLSEDELGGITVTPHIPLGSGRPTRCVVLTSGLNFINDNKFDNNSTEAVQPNWQIKWTVSSGERLFSSVMPVRPYDWDQSFKFRWAEVGWNVQATDSIYENVTAFLLWDIASKVYAGTFAGPYMPYPNASAVHSSVQTVHSAKKSAVAYMSAGWRNERNASEYIGHVKAWRDEYKIDGVYSDGLPEDDFLVAYEEVRMLRELFPSGPLIFHDTLDGYPSTFRPFLHSYATATLMAEGIENSDGLAWQWPRYAVSQFRRSNAFGACKCTISGQTTPHTMLLLDAYPRTSWLHMRLIGTGWHGAGISPPAPLDNYELAILVYGGRQRQSQASARYDLVLEQLAQVWREHGLDSVSEGTFYDQYYLPTAQNATGLHIGRSPMPIATVSNNDEHNGSTVSLSVFGNANSPIRVTLDGSNVLASSPLYTSPLHFSTGGQLRAATDMVGLAMSRELAIDF